MRKATWPSNENHSFDVEMAKDYDVPCAIVIQSFRFWIKKNAANGKNEHDGRWWTYNSKAALTALFPYWSEKQIRTIIDKLKDRKVIMTGNFNTVAYDRTLWYAFVDETRFLGDLAHSTGPNGQIDQTEEADQLDEKGRPIPSSIPVLEPILKTSAKPKKAPRVVDPLYNILKKTFEGKQPDGRFVNYAAEGKALNKMISEARARCPDEPEKWIERTVGAFLSLRSSRDSFWSKQPVLPSVIMSQGILPRVLEHVESTKPTNSDWVDGVLK